MVDYRTSSAFNSYSPCRYLFIFSNDLEISIDSSNSFNNFSLEIKFPDLTRGYATRRFRTNKTNL